MTAPALVASGGAARPRPRHPRHPATARQPPHPARPTAQELGNGDTPAPLAAARNLKFTGSLACDRDKALAYFETNAHRMQYARFRDLGPFIGSGAVEAGCKAVIGQRLKLSGMRWSQPGATGLLTLRCQEASGRWEEIWHQSHNQTSAA